MPVIEAMDIYRFYHIGTEETLALRGISLTVQVGELVAIQGPSGSGKSTLLACLSGIDEPDGGRVLLMGEQITRRPEPVRAAIRARLVGIMLQSGNLFSHLSVEDNVRLQMYLTGKPVDEHRVDFLLSTVGLTARRQARPEHISGGETARAAVAVAIAANPKLLIVDEPTGEVDILTEQAVIALLKQFCSDGGTVMVATHSPQVSAIADRVITLHDGRIVDHA